MKRRDFLKGTLAATMAATLSPSELFAREVEAVDIAVVNTLDKRAGVRRAIEIIGGMGKFVKTGQTVVIKPNMSFASGVETAANTDPAVVACVVELCREAGAKKVSVLDNTLSSPESALSSSGIREACNKIFPNCVHAVKDANFFKEVKIAGGKILKSVQIITEVLEADVLIAVPKVKSHGGAGVSMTLKGMMGLIYSRSHFHVAGLHDCVADLYSVLKPAFTLMDATRVMTTNGPGGPGKVIEYNDIIASADGVAADAYAAASYEWYGRKVLPANVGYLKEAALRKLGRIDTENLNIAREKI